MHGRLIFNVGARRSGTFWLQRLVSAHPAVSAVPSETYLFSSGVAPLLERFQHAARSSPAVGTVYADREIVLDAIRDLCDGVFGEFLEPGAQRVAERTPHHVHSLGLIAEIYPDARFVHIIRDGRDVARSLASRDFGTESVAEGAAEWRESILAARAADLPPDSYREVRYEDLVLDPAGAIAQLYGWLGLDTSPGVIKRALRESRVAANFDPARPEAVTGKWRDDFGAADLDAFEAAAGRLLEELGYEHEPVRSTTRRPRQRQARPGKPRLQRRRRATGRATGRGMEWTHPEALNAVLSDLLVGNFDGLGDRMAPDAAVRVITAGSDRAARGQEGLDLLREEFAKGRWFDGKQARGDVHPALPTSTVLYSHHDEAGTVRNAAVLVSFTNEDVSALAVYSFPSSPVANR